MSIPMKNRLTVDFGELKSACKDLSSLAFAFCRGNAYNADECKTS